MKGAHESAVLFVQTQPHLLNNTNVARFLSTPPPGIFTEFAAIAKAQSL